MATQQLLANFRVLVNSENPNLAEGKRLLSQLKVSMIRERFQLLPPFAPETLPQVKEQLFIARETLELACLLSITAKDVKDFQKNIAQLKPYYTDFSQFLPESERRWMLIGLHLLGLLAHNPIAEFHTELELVPPALRSNIYISFPIELEQQLMEGSYNRVLSARRRMPSPAFGYFMDMLADTVRERSIECAEVAYERLSIADAGQLFSLQPAALEQVAKQRNWRVEGDALRFEPAKNDRLEIPSHRIMSVVLAVATDMEQII